MSERKVLNKYYPPDYDPSKVPRVKRKNKLNEVRLMAPFNMKCNTCGDYIGHSTKFNAKKETVEETYNSVHIFRFYIKCKRCMATIILRTDPKEIGYEVEQGATESFKTLKLAERQARDEAVAEEEEEKIDPMKQLESRTKASRQQMEASEQIRNLRNIKHKFHSVDIDAVIKSKRQESTQEMQSINGTSNEDDEIRAEAIKLLKRKAITCSEDSSSIDNKSITKPVQKNLNTQGASKMISSSLLDLKKKIKLKVKPKQANDAND